MSQIESRNVGIPIKRSVRHRYFTVSFPRLVRHRGQFGTARHGLVRWCPAMIFCYRFFSGITRLYVASLRVLFCWLIFKNFSYDYKISSAWMCCKPTPFWYESVAYLTVLAVHSNMVSLKSNFSVTSRNKISVKFHSPRLCFVMAKFLLKMRRPYLFVHVRLCAPVHVCTCTCTDTCKYMYMSLPNIIGGHRYLEI